MHRLLPQRGLTGKMGLLALSLLLLCVHTAQGLTERDAAVYRQAFAQRDTGGATAIALAQGAKDPLLAEVLTWLAMARPDSPFSFNAYNAALAEHTDWPGRNAVRREAEKRLTVDNGAGTVLAFYGQTPPLSPNGLHVYAAALMAEGRTGQARDVIRAFWASGEMDAAQQQDFLNRYRSLLNRDQVFSRAGNLVWQGQSPLALALMNGLTPGDQAVIQARLALQGKGGNVDTLLAKVPANKASDPGLLYDRALWRSRDGNLTGAAELLREARGEGPLPAKWWKLRDDTVRRLAEQGQGDLAYRLADRHGVPDSAGVAYTEMEWLAGWVALTRLGKPNAASALAHFKNAYDAGVSINTRGKAAYWAGRAEAARRRKDAARDWYEKAARYGNTFYGQLAAAELYGEVRLEAPRDMQVTAAQRQAFEARETVRAIRQLEAINQRELALRFARALMDNATAAVDFALVAEMGGQMKRPEVAAFAGKVGGRKGYIVGAAAYPMLGKSLAPLVGGIGSSFAHAIIWQESGFNPQAKSGAGAEGLMQLMPGTARMEEKRLKIPKGDMGNPLHNLRLGNAHMQSLVDRFDGYLPLAIAGYNAGGGRPVQWMQRFGPPGCGKDKAAAMHGAVNWIESIPFPETRDYVKYVLGAEQVYRAIAGSGRTNLTLPERLTNNCS